MNILLRCLLIIKRILYTTSSFKIQLIGRSGLFNECILLRGCMSDFFLFIFSLPTNLPCWLSYKIVSFLQAVSPLNVFIFSEEVRITSRSQGRSFVLCESFFRKGQFGAHGTQVTEVEILKLIFLQPISQRKYKTVSVM